MSELREPTMYFVGGAPLTGKSEVAQQFNDLRQEAGITRPLDVVSTDGLRRVLLHNRTAITDSDLHLHRMDGTSELPDQEWIDLVGRNPGYFAKRQQRHQSPSVWQNGVMPYLEDNYERGVDTLFYGVAAMPSFMSPLAQRDIPYRAVFLGHNAHSPSEEYRQNISKAARENPGHWMQKWSDEKIDAYVQNVIPALSEVVMTEAEVLGYPYYDLSQGDHMAHHEDAAQMLLVGEN